MENQEKYNNLSKLVEKLKKSEDPKRKYEYILWLGKKLKEPDRLNELTPNQVVEIDKKFIEDTGLKASLTPSRSNGFLNILLKMQSQANEFL